MMNTETDQYCSILNFNSSFNWDFIPKTELINNVNSFQYLCSAYSVPVAGLSTLHISSHHPVRGILLSATFNT